MSKVLLVYASMTGNTEEMADLVERGLESEGVTVDKKEVTEVDIDTLEEYDYCLFGVYTWGDGELPDESLELYDDMESADLTGKTFAVFGTGDHAYEIFCGAVDLLEKVIKEQGGQLPLESLKVESFPEGEDADKSVQFGADFARIAKNEKEVSL
ncbi:flavodoxin [Salipaludibacillus sp. CUR1]|uniref:flavodoxin n=1 Tax=Salipaludibacillus sp. CUR1 TaxID=2820003 RepID=UPI001E563A27|nr:flavodoxin [Salipaludibacillus sp. CUR1]MCE7792945.1 flavodoxin [Salipaludibacillus sp. CUR1]